MEFKCPDCGYDKIECCLNGPHCATITNIDEEGDFDYGSYESSAQVDRFQCNRCGFVLELKPEGFPAYTVTEHEEVVEWLKEQQAKV